MRPTWLTAADGTLRFGLAFCGYVVSAAALPPHHDLAFYLYLAGLWACVAMLWPPGPGSV